MKKIMFIVLAISLISCDYTNYVAEERRLDLKVKELEVLEKYYEVSGSIKSEIFREVLIKKLDSLINDQEKTVADFDSLFPKTK